MQQCRDPQVRGMTEHNLMTTVRPAELSTKNVQDPTLFYSPNNEANRLMNMKTIRKRMSQRWAYRKTVLPFVGSSSIVFFFDSCMWATVHLCKHEDQFQRIFQNVEEPVQKMV